MSQVRLFQDNNYLGREITLTDSQPNFLNINFNDQLSSLIVDAGPWTLYEDINFGGNSVTVTSNGGPANNGEYPDPSTIAGRNDAYSSIRKNA